MTPLHQAVIENHTVEVRRLVDSLGDTNFIDNQGFTPKEVALLLGKGDCAEILGFSLPTVKVVYKNEHIVQKQSVGDFLANMGVAYTPTLRFRDYTSIENTINACPRLLKHPKMGQRVQELGEQYSEKIYAGETANLTITWMGEPLHYGVITNRNLVEGDYIGCYTGYVRPLSRVTPMINGYCVLYPTKWLTGGLYVIDARFHGNLLRYVNHSDFPNLRGEWALDRGLLHLLFFAAEDIPRGNALTIDYGQAYWRYRTKSVFTNFACLHSRLFSL